MRAYIRTGKKIPVLSRKRGDHAAAEVVGKIIGEWNRKERSVKRRKTKPVIPPTICLSREMGAGVSEVADILSAKTGYRVIDREIIEYLFKNEKISKTTLGFFNERYPGLISEYRSTFADQKAFVKSDNIQRLFSAILYFAYSGPSIIIGRGAYLLLPRDRIMAVRFIASREYRTNRLCNLLNSSFQEIERSIDLIDREQANFFKHVYGKKHFTPHEFDMIINCDAVKDPERVAQIIYDFFEQKFGTQAA